MTLKVVEPITINESSLFSSDIAEPDLTIGEQEWYLTKAVDLPQVGINTTLSADAMGPNVIIGKNDLYVSNDYGETFYVPATFPTNLAAYGVCINKTDETIMYACTNSSVYKSTDSGATWVDTGLDVGGVVITSVKAYGNMVAVAGGDSFISNDGGSTWSTYASVAARDCAITSTYVVFISENGVVYSSVKSSSMSFTTYDVRSGDESTFAEWRIEGFKNTFIATWGSTPMSDSDNLAFRSDDGGQTWSAIEFDDVKFIKSINVSESGYFAMAWSTSGGIQVSTDLGLTWKLIENEEVNSYTVCAISDNFTYSLSGLTKTVDICKIWRINDEAIVSSLHKKYRCLTAFSSDYPPESSDTSVSTSTWIEVGPTNKWAMFDEKTSTPTVSSSSFSVVLKPYDYINTLAVFESYGVQSVDIEVKDQSDSVVYTRSMQLIDTSPIYDYYTYFFYQLSVIEEFVKEDLPPYLNPTVTLTFNGTDMSVGNISIGFANQIGILLEDSKTDTVDYSRQEYDDYGNLTYIERPLVKLNTYEVLSDKSLSPYIQRLIKNLRGKNTVWIGSIGSNQKLITYGRYERSPIPFTMPTKVRYSITVRGSI